MMETATQYWQQWAHFNLKVRFALSNRIYMYVTVVVLERVQPGTKFYLRRKRIHIEILDRLPCIAAALDTRYVFLCGMSVVPPPPPPQTASDMYVAVMLRRTSVGTPHSCRAETSVISDVDITSFPTRGASAHFA